MSEERITRLETRQEDAALRMRELRKTIEAKPGEDTLRLIIADVVARAVRDEVDNAFKLQANRLPEMIGSVLDIREQERARILAEAGVGKRHPALEFAAKHIWTVLIVAGAVCLLRPDLAIWVWRAISVLT